VAFRRPLAMMLTRSAFGDEAYRRIRTGGCSMARGPSPSGEGRRRRRPYWVANLCDNGSGFLSPVETKNENEDPPATRRRCRPWVCPFKALDNHRRTVLDAIGVPLLLIGIVLILFAILSASDTDRIKPADWIAIGSTLVAAGGIFLGLGGSRTDSGNPDDRAKT
jgi:hypothetical protein